MNIINNKRNSLESLGLNKRIIDLIFRILALTIVILPPIIALLALSSSAYAEISESTQSLLLAILYLNVPLFIFGIYRFFSLSNFQNAYLVKPNVYVYRILGLIIGIISMVVFFGIFAIPFNCYGTQYGCLGMTVFEVPSVTGWLYIFGADLADYVYIRNYPAS